jgi:LPXTG-motif cell wall-anchored protein
VIELVKNGEETGKTLVLNEDNNWKGSFKDLDKYDENGNEIEYTVKENTNSYQVVIESDGNGGFIVTNYPKNYSRKTNTKNKKTTNKTTNVNGPKTGDSSDVMGYMMLLATAAAAAVIVIFAKRREKKEER